jgi:hypothetical protein
MIISVNGINWLMLIMESKSVLCKVQTGFLYLQVTEMNVSL